MDDPNIEGFTRRGRRYRVVVSLERPAAEWLAAKASAEGVTTAEAARDILLQARATAIPPHFRGVVPGIVTATEVAMAREKA